MLISYIAFIQKNIILSVFALLITQMCIVFIQLMYFKRNHRKKLFTMNVVKVFAIAFFTILILYMLSNLYDADLQSKVSISVFILIYFVIGLSFSFIVIKINDINLRSKGDRNEKHNS